MERHGLDHVLHYVDDSVAIAIKELCEIFALWDACKIVIQLFRVFGVQTAKQHGEICFVHDGSFDLEIITRNISLDILRVYILLLR